MTWPTLPTPGSTTGWGPTINSYLSALSAAIDKTAVNVQTYGAVGDGSTNDLTAIQNALNALPASGGTVFFPRTSAYYAVGGTLSVPNGTTFLGESSNSTAIVQTSSSAMFAPTGTLRDCLFQGISFQTNSGHIFDLGSTGSLIMTTFYKCQFVQSSNTASVMRQNGSGQFIWNHFTDCDFTRFSGSTVSGFDLRNTNGALSANTWRNCRVTSSNGTGGGPFWKLSGDLASTYAYDNTWEQIVGEQNKSGLIQIDSAYGATFNDVVDYDVSGSYTASLIKVGKAAGGYPTGIKLSNVGNRGGTLNGTTTFQFEATAALATPPILDRVWDASRVRYVSIPGGSGAVIMGPGGYSPAMTQSTVSKTLDPTVDGVVIFNGTSLTCTLSDPTQLTPGFIYRVKNINASSLTVTSGVTIDGAGTKTLTQYQAGTYVSDGVRWLTL